MPRRSADLVQGKCLLGLSAVDFTAAAVAQGAALRTVGAQYQRSAFCIVSLASRPIPEPRAMIGRRIGVQAANTLVFSTFLQLNGIDQTRSRWCRCSSIRRRWPPARWMAESAISPTSRTR